MVVGVAVEVGVEVGGCVAVVVGVNVGVGVALVSVGVGVGPGISNAPSLLLETNAHPLALFPVPFFIHNSYGVENIILSFCMSLNQSSR